MKLPDIFHRLLALTAACLMLTGCSGLIYQDEGDCDPHYKVKFIYDMNMSFADAFPRQVSAVTLYLVNPETGKIVWQKHESGDALAQPGYLMDVDGVEPGTYTLIAWAGKGHKTHFSVTDTDIHTDLHCRLLTKQHPELGTAYHNEDLDPLFHGKLELQEFTDRQGTHVFTVPLTKDTNNIQVVLQHLSGAKVDASQLTFTITDRNAHMNWDNSLVKDADSPVTYYHWDRRQAVGTIISPELGIEQSHSAAKAELSVARLMDMEDPMLTVTRPDGTDVFSIHLLDWCRAFKSQHLQSMLTKGRATMSDQEFFDRQDDWHFAFFLDDGDRWIDSYIFIESFKVVEQHVDL